VPATCSCRNIFALSIFHPSVDLWKLDISIYFSVFCISSESESCSHKVATEDSGLLRRYVMSADTLVLEGV
jgi:hypothetical protein